MRGKAPPRVLVMEDGIGPGGDVDMEPRQDEFFSGTMEDTVVAHVKGEESGEVPAAEGQPGYLVCRGGNIMSGYVNNDEATAKAIHDEGWYTNLGDIVFWRADASDGQVRIIRHTCHIRAKLYCRYDFSSIHYF